MSAITTRRLATRSVPAEPVPTTAFLAALAAPGEQAGWCAQPAFSAAGAGAAELVTANGEGRFRDLAAALDGRLEDGIAFAGGSFNGRNWTGFEQAAAWVPQIALIRDENSARLVATAEQADELDELLARGREAVAHASARAPIAVAVRAREFAPADGEWDAAVRNALSLIASGEMEKVVLARRLRLDVDRVPSPWDLAAALAERYPSCLCYGVANKGGAFVGASPELLVELDGLDVHASPAAGTIAAADTSGLETPKLQHEQKLVVDSVFETLAPLCEDLHAGPSTAVAAGPVQHLATNILGRLAQPAHVLELVSALHPTPAVGGLPRDAAIPFISETEGFARGWYAGPIGIVRPDGGGAFGVALRGALLGEGRIDLFAGAGIVEGSLASEERAEVDLKLGAVANALNL